MALQLLTDSQPGSNFAALHQLYVRTHAAWPHGILISFAIHTRPATSHLQWAWKKERGITVARIRWSSLRHYQCLLDMTWELSYLRVIIRDRNDLSTWTPLIRPSLQFCIETWKEESRILHFWYHPQIASGRVWCIRLWCEINNGEMSLTLETVATVATVEGAGQNLWTGPQFLVLEGWGRSRDSLQRRRYRVQIIEANDHNFAIMNLLTRVAER